ncbi:homoserine O-acetyltransferase MetX [Corynebacterium pyruviciproducens]|uniref:homoserine O-acetyltransferase MetX n=1 Tax=Corynebacterium pyruviciproducens TaxID=598660 RepID=UPI00254CA1C6|nr:homoserine O-acetyltransferase [Corynebacterium pyruviciproducens]MDK7213323.1 homoserine O-acetyltransferase [Corynebacterium pyruviciproducens]
MTNHHVTIGDFHTEAGAVIPQVEFVYRTWGTFRGDNAVLVEHALTGDHNADEWWPGLIGPGLAIDTRQYFVICANVLGGCKGTTGPSSPHPDDGKAFGSRFPAISIRDQVEAEYAFLHAIGVDRLFAVMGGSMGGARALEWEVSHPEYIERAFVLAVSARASAWQIGIQTAQIQFIEQDPNWCGGDFYSRDVAPHDGMAAARRIAHLTYRGEQEIDERFGVDPQDNENPLGPYRDPKQRFQVQSYLDHQAEKLVARFDPGSYVALTEALNRHDVGRGRGGLIKALDSTKVPTMVAGVDTDILYPYHQQEHLARNLGNVIGMHKIVSPIGHDAFLAETRQLDRIFRNFFHV